MLIDVVRAVPRRRVVVVVVEIYAGQRVLRECEHMHMSVQQWVARVCVSMLRFGSPRRGGTYNE